MKSLLKDARELNFSELMNLNGGYSGSSGGSGGTIANTYYSSSSNSSSSSSHSSVTCANSSYSGCSGGSKGVIPNDYYPGCTTVISAGCFSDSSSYDGERISWINGKAYSSMCGFISANYASTTSGDTPTTPTTDPSSTPTHDPTVEDLYKTNYEKLSKEQREKLLQDLQYECDKKYEDRIKYDLVTGFRCDNFVQAELEKAGYNINLYLAGDANQYKVADHIANLDKNTKYDKSTVENDNVYVVFMEGKKPNSDNDFTPHCGILSVNQNGKCTFYDNSSCNKETLSNGVIVNGFVAAGKYTDISDFQSDYSYENFYYQKLR